jgi:hypothetical protein
MPIFTNSVIAGLTRNLRSGFGIWGLRVKPAMTLLINAYFSDITSKGGLVRTVSLWRGQGEVKDAGFSTFFLFATS